MNTSFDWAGGGLVTTAADLVTFLGGLLHCALFEERWLGELRDWRDGLRWPPEGAASYLRYGLGLGVKRAAGEDILGATGVWVPSHISGPPATPQSRERSTSAAPTVRRCSMRSSVR